MCGSFALLKQLECDLMELKDIGAPEPVKGGTQVSLTPFEIKTYKIKY